MGLKVGDYLGDGWTVAHAQAATTEVADGPGNQTITVTPANYEAQHRDGDNLQVLNGNSEDDLKARIDNWNSRRPSPNPLTEDGNRELSTEEKLESAKATAMQHVTIGARVGVEADLTPAADKPKPVAAIIKMHPAVNVEKVTGDQAASIAAAASGAPAAPSAPDTSSDTPASKSGGSKTSKPSTKK